jgi:hypothetical protein
MKRIWLSIVLLMFLPGISSSQQTGRIEFPSLGVSFAIPPGWIGQEGEGVYIIGHNTIPGIVFILPHADSKTTDELATDFLRGLQFDATTILKPVNSVQQLNEQSVGGEFDGIYNNSPANAYIIAMSNDYGNGITIVAVTSAEAYKPEIYKGVAMDVWSSVIFTEVKPGTSQQGMAASGSLADWKYQLGDTKLTYKESYYSGGEHGGGYNITEEIHLCKAGYFLYYDNNMIAAGSTDVSGYSAGSSSGHGTWNIEDRGGSYILVLSFKNSTVKEYSLAWGEESKLFLNGFRFYRTWEGDNAPDCFK